MDNTATYYCITASVSNGVTGINEKTIPTEFNLLQNYPNPFNPTTTIKYSIPGTVEIRHSVSLRIYDILGSEIATLVDETKAAGNYKVQFDASALSSGTYFYTLSTGNFRSTKKMILLR